jgi:hypothetical protein
LFYEIANVRQNPGEERRRWLWSEDMDLTVWYDDLGQITSWQLAYRQAADEFALTWGKSRGWRHQRVDTGGGSRLAKQTALLSHHVDFDPTALGQHFARIAHSLPPAIDAFVRAALRQMNTAAR